MNSPTSRPNMTSIAAACILSGGLITAAIIDSHKPAPLVVQAPENVPPYVLQGQVKIPEPPISQEEVEKQVEAQLLTSPKLHSFPYKGSSCDLTSAHTTQVEYTSKDDQFFVLFDLKWAAHSGATTESNPSPHVATHIWSGGTETPENTAFVTLSNDGYGHYSGILRINNNDETVPDMTITVR